MKKILVSITLMLAFGSFISLKAQDKSSKDSLKIALVNDFYAPKLKLKEKETVFPVYIKNYQAFIQRGIEEKERSKYAHQWDYNKSIGANLVLDAFTNVLYNVMSGK